MSRTSKLVEVLARSLVDQPELVRIKEVPRRDGTYIEVSTGDGDLGKVIGRQGRTAKAVRNLAAIAAEMDGVRASVGFADEGN